MENTGLNKINKNFNAKTQYLMSYKLVFNFATDAGILDYLNGQNIEIEYENYNRIM